MAVDLLTWVCEKLTNNAPHATNGLADFVADRVLRRFVVLTELENMMEADPEDVRLPPNELDKAVTDSHEAEPADRTNLRV